ncbi:potassium transporter KtrAB, KtrB subunit [Campylobacter iguaniorum]|uniref:Potassium transporter KtrAB, KtrB subunit n=1 Tax=Campylobacter iguaniorum TaxID=1244531 RepID=A0A076FHV2_9BACT|nr:TrkH family potassium uptake protein [Campylobacter iguaniorum]AII15369.1 potassium transporter KtrAB, KtrB subunit [Campylobacter iguaniorum]
MNKIFLTILISYVLLAFLGAVILSFDVMRVRPIAFIDLLFTATSAVCVTGLIVANTATDFSIYGQGIILLLIQAGGFGYMSLAGFLFLLIGKRVDFKGKMTLKESLDYPTMQGLIKYLKKIFIFTLCIELVGAVLLTLNFMLDMSLTKAIWAGIFHSVSAFNNAGFSIFEYNLMGYRDNFVLNLTICFLIIFGGLGFLVLSECFNFYKKSSRISIHTRIVLIATAICLVLGIFVLLVFEWNNPKSIGEYDVFSKFLTTFFASVNLRTSGFNTIDLSTLNDQSLFFSSLLMIVGAAPGGTAGGIKVTTVAVLLIYAYCSLRDKDPVVFKREIPEAIVKKAFLIFIIATLYIVVSIMILSATNDKTNSFFLGLLFEICSAFGTVGVSVGDGGSLSLSAKFSEFGKLYIILLMFMGRVGVLVFSMAILKKSKSINIKYPQEGVVL